MRETIKEIVLAGGMVNFPFKRSHKDWFGEAKIMQIKLYPNEPIINSVHWPYGMERFDTLDEALDFYMKTVFTKKNLALAYNGIRKREMTTKDFDDLPEGEIERLCKQYNDEFFAIDYPFAKKGKK